MAAAVVLQHLPQIHLVLQLIHGVLHRRNHHLNLQHQHQHGVTLHQLLILLLQQLLILGDHLLHHKRLIHSDKHRHSRRRIHQMDLVQVQQIHSVLNHQRQIHNLLLLIHLDNRQVNIGLTDIFYPL